MAFDSSLKILFVDDSVVIRDMIESSLMEIGYMRIQGAVDGLDGLAKSEEEEYDFIIADINMPNMDGITMISELRKKLDYISTPIMVLSTEWSKEMKQKGKEAGATSWIVKPFNTEKLEKAIQLTLDKVNEI
jgi:two-component system chemotaxis response regulator CheY